jgi:hypothetical protein
MSLPNVITYNVATGNATTIVNVAPIGSGKFTLNTSIVPNFPLQQRVLVTSAGNDSTIFFHIVGLNQAGFTVQEWLAGSNSTFAQSQLDYAQIVSIQPSTASNAQTLGTTAGTVSVGVSATGGVASSLWQIMNWHVTPANIAVSGVTLGPQGATWSVQYTYDDPNNLPNYTTVPQPFNHPTLVSQTGSLDGAINDPVTAVRLTMNGGTGTVRATFIQAGIGSP